MSAGQAEDKCQFMSAGEGQSHFCPPLVVSHGVESLSSLFLSCDQVQLLHDDSCSPSCLINTSDQVALRFGP